MYDTRPWHRGGLLVVVIVAAIVVAILASGERASATDMPDESPAFVQNAGEVAANCRYGTVPPKGSGLQKWLDELGAGWWLDFQPNYETPAENGAEYAHVIWVKQKKSGYTYLDGYDVTPAMSNNSLGYLIERRPGRMWIVGNEVDRGPDPGAPPSLGQGDMYPEMYARAYHDIYHYIKTWDPTALVTPSALVQVTPMRITYLDRVWNEYMRLYGQPMPADLWNMHLYILPEVTWQFAPSTYASVAVGTSPATGKRESEDQAARCARDDVYCLAEHDDMSIFIEQVELMRNWMKDHGQQEKPLIITEYSLILGYEPVGESCVKPDEFGGCFTPERVEAFATASFQYLESAADPSLGYVHDDWRLVQQWMWYSIHQTQLGKPSNLAVDRNEPLRLTPAGEVFSETAKLEAPTVNLIATTARDATAPIDEDGFGHGKVTIGVRNNGNRRVGGPMTMTIYSDATLTQVIGEVTVPEPDESFVGLTGCAVREVWVTANVTFEATQGQGVYLYWAEVNSDGAIEETSDEDNVVQGSITATSGGGAYIPVVVR